MPAILAYISLIIIWSTTPLAIKISNESVLPAASLVLRIVMAILLALIVMLLMRRRECFRPRYYRIYLVGSLGIFPNMSLVYHAAEYIPSGLIAVLLGMTPFITGIAAHFVLKENLFTARKLSALLIAMAGLVIIFYGQITVDGSGVVGVGLMLASTIIFGVSSVYVKKLSTQIAVHPFDQTLGAMLFSLPGLLLSWWLADGFAALELSDDSFWAISYLAIIGSLVGFVAYFYVLNNLGVGPVSLIPLMTPGLALCVGAFLAAEQVPQSTLWGTGLIVSALFVYEGLVAGLSKQEVAPIRP